MNNTTIIDTVATRCEIDAAAIAAARHPNTNTIGLAGFEDPAGHMIVGITYRCDYAAEQEYGIGDLRKAITGTNPRQFTTEPAGRAHVRAFDDVNGFVLSVRPLPEHIAWGDNLPWVDGGEYTRSWTRRNASVAVDCARVPIDRLNWMKVSELRELAAKRGVKPAGRTKAAYIEALTAHAIEDVDMTVAPAWFQNGKTLIVRADQGSVAKVVGALVDAIAAGTFAIGNASGPFHSGILFYDARDESEQLRREREEQFDWHDARMAELEPVAAQLRADQIRWHFLGNPREDADGQVVYWLNGSGQPQPYGWYTLAQLAARTFIDDAEARAAERANKKERSK